MAVTLRQSFQGGSDKLLAVFGGSKADLEVDRGFVVQDISMEMYWTRTHYLLFAMILNHIFNCTEDMATDINCTE